MIRSLIFVLTICQYVGECSGTIPASNDLDYEVLDVADSKSQIKFAFPSKSLSVTGRQVPASSNMPQIIGIDVECGRESMLVRVRFNAPFNGEIYSKGHYRNPDCRYVKVGGNQVTYQFTIMLDRCGTTFTDNLQNGGQAYLENTIIVQMEKEIQEIWDAARRIRCLWNGLFQKTVSSRLDVNMLDVVSITYSGDSVDTYMDIQLGQGPNAPVASGLVKIGDTLTLVVYVIGGSDLDVHVRECYAFSVDRTYNIQLTDVNGCILKPKLMGPWLTSTKTGNSGASVLAYSFLQAFKFPDTMDVNLECNVIICKYKCRSKCQSTSNVQGPVPVQTVRSKRDVGDNETSPSIKLVRTVRVLSPEDIPLSINTNDTVVRLETGRLDKMEVGDFCMSTPSFVVSLVVVMLVMVVSCVLTSILCIRIRHLPSSSKASSTRRTLSSSPQRLLVTGASKA